MKYSSLIDNVHSVAWGLNIQEAYLFDWLYSLPSWAKSSIIDGQDFYFASRNKACQELPLITDKADTMYRHYKALEVKGLISIKKVDGADYVALTKKAKEWGRQSEHSEKIPKNTDFNPDSLGKNSDILDNNTLDNKYNTDANASAHPEELFHEFKNVPRGIQGKKTVDKKIGPNLVYHQVVEFWLKEFHPGWSFRAVHGKAVKGIIAQIESRARAAGTEKPEPEEVYEYFRVMCNKLPEWFRDKDLQIIDSKFNEIITQIENGRQERTRAGSAQNRSYDTSWISREFGDSQ